MNEADGVVTFTVVKRTQTTETVVVQFFTQDGSATGKLSVFTWDFNEIR